MRRIVAIADVPGHLDREGAQVDRYLKHLQPRVVRQPAADQRGERRAIIGDGHHFRHGEKVGDGDRHVAFQLLLRQRKLVAPFSQTMASPRSSYLVQSAAALRKPEVQSFIAWLRREAQAAADAAPAGDSLSGGLRSPGRDSARSRGRATA